jgi:outer membrane scaffolding protein for murein synthesis (MipA/OmpV family)
MRNNRLSRLLTFVFLTLLLLARSPGGAFAANSWDFMMGGGIYRANTYPGSNDYYVVPVPMARASYGKGNVSYSLSIPDGLGVTWSRQEKGLMGRINMNYGEIRDSEEYSVLGMMEEHSERTKRLLVDTPTAEAPIVYDATIGYQALNGMIGASVGYYPTSVDYQLSGQEDRDYQGLVYSLFYSTDRPVNQKLSFSAMLGAEYMNQDYADAWYTVQFPTARLNVFEADAGLRDVMLSVQVTSMFSEKVGISFLGAFTKLLGDAGQSPYTLEKFQSSTLFYAFYNF